MRDRRSQIENQVENRAGLNRERAEPQRCGGPNACCLRVGRVRDGSGTRPSAESGGPMPKRMVWRHAAVRDTPEGVPVTGHASPAENGGHKPCKRCVDGLWASECALSRTRRSGTPQAVKKSRLLAVGFRARPERIRTAPGRIPSTADDGPATSLCQEECAPWRCVCDEPSLL